MNIHSFKQFIRRRQPATHAERHKAIIAPYRHWALMLGISTVLACCALGVGAYQFFLVSSEQQIETPILEQPEQLVDQERLRSILGAVEADARAYEEMRGPLPEAPERMSEDSDGSATSTSEQQEESQVSGPEEVRLIAD